jgi:hypothetical protein
MKNPPTKNKATTSEDLKNPNDDGCVLGTAGRDEDPNATRDWDHNRSAGANSRGNDGRKSVHASDSIEDHANSLDSTLPPNGVPETGEEASEEGLNNTNKK